MRRAVAPPVSSPKISGKVTLLNSAYGYSLTGESNYWTAVLFFRHENGTYKKVPIMVNAALPAGTNGGMTVYCRQP